MQEFDSKTAAKEAIIWLVEAGVEGAALNFATHYLFGVRLTPFHALAHGILVKEAIYTYERIRAVYNGSVPKVPENNNDKHK